MTMNLRYFIKICLSFIRNPASTVYALTSGRETPSRDLTRHIRHGADWLLLSQECASDGDGYSRRFSLISGWDRCYIETTGYIIPTLFDVAELLEDTRYRDSALRAGNWLLTVQRQDGAFEEIDAWKPMVFDTGQVLIGLNRMYKETSDDRFRLSACRAAQWLVEVQEESGAWVRHAFNDRPHSYYSRVGAALLEAGKLYDNRKFIEAGERNLNWVLDQETDNGYFRYSEFEEGVDALLHTLVYIIEGFSMAFDLTGEKKWGDALVRGAQTLQCLTNEEGLLYSQYDSQWIPTNTEYCVTGLAQYAGICFDTFPIIHDPRFCEVGNTLLDKLSAWQQTRGENISGALPSSVPVWGYYGGMAFFNWNNKFYLDAALKSLKNETNQEQMMGLV